jgi:hypothetical protein
MTDAKGFQNRIRCVYETLKTLALIVNGAINPKGSNNVAI